MATGLVVAEFVWRHSIAHPRIPLTRRNRASGTTIFSIRASYRLFCIKGDFVLNFVAMATRVGRCKTSLTSFDTLTPNTPVRRKHLRDMSYTSRVIADFVPNFVAMATWIIRV